MSRESKLQGGIIRWLKSEGAYVVKPRAGPGVPIGCPDIFFVYDGAWGFIEVKASMDADYRDGQEATLARLSNWSPFVYTVCPENWPQVKKELETLFF